MAYGDAYQSQVGPGGSPQLGGISPDALGAGVGAAIEHAGQVGDSIAARAHEIETQQNRESHWLGYSAAKADGLRKYSDWYADAKNTIPADKLLDQASAKWSEIFEPIVPADPKIGQRAFADLHEDWDQQASQIDLFKRGQQVKGQLTDYVGTQTSLLNGITQATSGPDALAAVDAANTAYAQTLSGMTNFDEATKKDELQKFHGASTVAAIRNALTREDVPGAGQLLGSELAKNTVPSDELEALNSSYRVLKDGVASRERAAAKVATAEAEKTLDLQALQFEQGRPSFQEAQQLAANYRSIGNDLKAQKWGGVASDVGASEAYRGATDEQRNQRIQELRAKPTLTPEEGSQLRGLKGQAEYLSKQTAVGHLAYATGRPVEPIDFADPASIARRAATFHAAVDAGYGTSGSAVLEPDEVQHAHEIATGGQLGDKVGLLMAMEQFGRLIDPVREQIGGDADFHAAVALTRRPTSRAIIAMTLEGAKSHDKAVMTVAKDDAGQPLTRSPDQIRDIYFGGSTALLPPDYVSDQKRNIENLYFYKAKATGTKAFDPDLWGQAAKEVMGAGSATWAGDRVLLPEGMPRDSFYRRMGTATRQDWQLAAHGAGLPRTSGGEMTPDELRSYVPTKVTDGVYQLRRGQGTGATYARNKDGTFFTFDPAKLWDGPRLSVPHAKDVDAEIERGLRNRTIR